MKQIKKEEIKYVRNKMGLTQQAFAEMIGASRATIVELEKGHRKAQGKILIRLNELKNDILEKINSKDAPNTKGPIVLKKKVVDEGKRLKMDYAVVAIFRMLPLEKQKDYLKQMAGFAKTNKDSLISEILSDKFFI